MNSTSVTETDIRLSVDLKGLMTMCGVGRSAAEKIGSDAGAVVRIGRRKLYNVQKIQNYLDEISGA